MTSEELQQIIDNYNEYLKRMGNAIEHICEDLQNSDYQELGLAMPAIVEGLQWIHDATTEFLGLGKIETKHYQALQNVIKNMGTALENKDYLLLHDLFEFELAPLLDDLKVTNNNLN